jgi:hypothetical protein
LDQTATGNGKQAVKEEVLSLAGLVGALYSFDGQPVPFIYLHTLFLMTVIFMPLMAYSLANNLIVNATNSILEEIFGAMIMTIFLLYTIGLVTISKLVF